MKPGVRWPVWATRESAASTVARTSLNAQSCWRVAGPVIVAAVATGLGRLNDQDRPLPGHPRRRGLRPRLGYSLTGRLAVARTTKESAESQAGSLGAPGRSMQVRRKRRLADAHRLTGFPRLHSFSYPTRIFDLQAPPV